MGGDDGAYGMEEHSGKNKANKSAICQASILGIKQGSPRKFVHGTGDYSKAT